MYDLGLLCDVCAVLRDEARAALLYDRLLSYKGRYLSVSWIVNAGSAARCLGRLATTLHRWGDAERHFEEAMSGDEQMGGWAWLARSQCDYAGMLSDRGGPGDSEKAIELLGRSLETCQELGLKGWLDMCLEQKLRTQGVDSGVVSTSVEAIARSVGESRPDMTPHSGPDGTVTLVFSDMEDYTGMLERLGDLAAHRIVRDHNAIVREQTQEHGGHEVELRGDGFLLAFGSARQAVLCAIALQRAMARHSERAEHPIRIRIGLHTGEAIRDAERFFGQSVVQAFRIADLARGGEILISSLTRDLVRTAGDLAFEEEREVELKGLAGTHRVHAVRWE
jgi:class 3 adenylate cyclase